ncbi:MAG: hypothetical protein A2Z07_12130 [Armatimonadetes bacterium RBG_16_67_12]|nr:MAG: hypothetical protein A2Z07_12130 [Armatimonadetes bacterium RBG_16_67_12]
MHDATARIGTRRRWLTLLFCVAPLAVLAAVFVFGIPISQVLVWALILLCPLSHLLHGHGGHSRASRADTNPGAREGAPESSKHSGSCH